MKLPLFFLLWLSCCLAGRAGAAELVAGPLQMLPEQQGPLSLAEARAQWEAGHFRPLHDHSPNLGLGAPPTWLHLRVHNPTNRSLTGILSLENAWLDELEIHLSSPHSVPRSLHLGDHQPFSRRPVPDRLFSVSHRFAPGDTEVFLRATTPDPLLLPLRLRTVAEHAAARTGEAYWYGVLYGGLSLLSCYNLMLFFSLHSRRYLFYSLYLVTFLALNLTYTGHGFQWLWPDSPAWQQGAPPLFMVLSAVAGLLFADRFLELGILFTRLHRLLLSLCALALTGVVATLALDHRLAALWIAFGFVTLFPLLMIALGLRALGAGVRSARFFLLASVSHAVGTGLTVLTVMGVLPWQWWSYHAVEAGMLVDSVLLAFALADQYRILQREKYRAESLANTDPLTGLHNRRAFQTLVPRLCRGLTAGEGQGAVAVMDLDHFKNINDRHGHTTGDRVLAHTAALLSTNLRKGDVLARWGGEEFILFLPNTSLSQAVELCERLRRRLAAAAVAGVRVTASFGVAHGCQQAHELETLIQAADRQLYRAKTGGRNRVCHAEEPLRALA